MTGKTGLDFARIRNKRNSVAGYDDRYYAEKRRQPSVSERNYMTDYKELIEQTVLYHADRFEVPDCGAREYLLLNRCKADFCFNIIPSGRLFIEDDDAMRGLGNLIKYWAWCELNPDALPVHVIHILETSRPAAIENIKFLGDKMEQQLPQFTYNIITLDNWQEPYDVWLPQFKDVVANIAGGSQ